VRPRENSGMCHLDVRPLDPRHRPAVDVLFHSAAEVFDGRVLGVVMTGMGSDGRDGAAWIKAKGGVIFTESEASCVVYGMPRSVVEAGLSDGVFPLELMARAIMERVWARKCCSSTRPAWRAEVHAGSWKGPVTTWLKPRMGWPPSSSTLSRNLTSSCWTW